MMKVKGNFYIKIGYFRLGVQVLADALKMPLKMVIENKIGQDCGHIINKIESSNNMFAGFDCRKGKILSLLILNYRGNC